MNTILKTAIIGLFALTLSACTQDNAEETTSDVGTQMHEGMDDMKDKVGEWSDNIESELSAFDNEFQSMKASLQGDEVEAEKQDKLADLERMRTDIENKVENAGDVTEEKWDDFRSEVEGQVAELKKELNEVRN